MDPLIQETIDALRNAGWTVELIDPPRPLPEAIVRRYPHLPALLVEWATRVERCVSPDEGCWVAGAEDYGADPADDRAFRWDEFERMMLDPKSGGGDEPELTTAFWDHHFPIMLYVAGDYEYVAICTDPQSRHFGAAMHGYVNDYDSPDVMADSFAGFLRMLGDAAAGPATGSAAQQNYLVLLVHEEIVEDRPPPRESVWKRVAAAVRSLIRDAPPLR